MAAPPSSVSRICNNGPVRTNLIPRQPFPKTKADLFQAIVGQGKDIKTAGMAITSAVHEDDNDERGADGNGYFSDTDDEFEEGN